VETAEHRDPATRIMPGPTTQQAVTVLMAAVVILSFFFGFYARLDTDQRVAFKAKTARREQRQGSDQQVGSPITD
jgi:hypothetical protein